MQGNCLYIGFKQTVTLQRKGKLTAHVPPALQSALSSSSHTGSRSQSCGSGWWWRVPSQRFSPWPRLRTGCTLCLTTIPAALPTLANVMKVERGVRGTPYRKHLAFHPQPYLVLSLSQYCHLLKATQQRWNKSLEGNRPNHITIPKQYSRHQTYVLWII